MAGYIQTYCERTGPGLFAEPFNLLSNVAFFVALLAAMKLACKRREPHIDIAVLLFLMAAIGIGTTLFHAFATAWAALTDMVPVLLFQIVYFAVYPFYVIEPRHSKPRTVIILTAFILALVAFSLLTPHGLLNGSVRYVPALVFTSVLGIYHYRSNKAGRSLLLLASGLFALSLAFRTLDQVLCAYIPAGLHFMWHILNAVVLYLAFKAYLMNSRHPSSLKEKAI